MTGSPPRGFSEDEFATRLGRIQAGMNDVQMDAMLLTTEPEIRYVTGFFTQFWESPTRPWFVVVPLSGKPIAVIPEIGRAGMEATWVDDIRTWMAPNPEDDGITLLHAVIDGLPRRHARLGVPLGHESHVRMPVGDFRRLTGGLRQFQIADSSDLLRQIRFVKSEAEVEKIAHACALTSAAYEALPDRTRPGETERQICQRFRIDLLERGADHSPYLISGSGPGGYDSIIMGPTDRIIENGDIMIIDTGTTFDGYFSDFDRNFAFGQVDDDVKRAYDVVYAATDAGFNAARPGATMADIWAAMWRVLDAGGALGNTVGRLGHGLGMQLTEWPSVSPDDKTELVPGAVITLEPGMEYKPGKQMVHEEDIVITDDGATMLTRRAAAEIPVIS